MEMTIDETIESLENMKALVGANHFSINNTIAIIRKYQKIEQIYKEWFSDKGRTSADAYVRIGEVLEDGNVD